MERTVHTIVYVEGLLKERARRRVRKSWSSLAKLRRPGYGSRHVRPEKGPGCRDMAQVKAESEEKACSGRRCSRLSQPDHHLHHISTMAFTTPQLAAFKVPAVENEPMVSISMSSAFPD